MERTAEHKETHQERMKNDDTNYRIYTAYRTTGKPGETQHFPMMHNTGFQALGLDFVYLCFDVNEETLEDAVKGLRTLHVKGFNLTMPNKNKILEYLDELSPAARLIGAVNTVENREES